MQFWLDFGPVLVKMHACQYKKRRAHTALLFLWLSCITAEQNPVVAGNDFG